jgi:hypothetical protein
LPLPLAHLGRDDYGLDIGAAHQRHHRNWQRTRGVAMPKEPYDKLIREVDQAVLIAKNVSIFF